MPYQLEVSRQAKKQLAGLPAQQQQIIAAWIDKNLADCSNPRAVSGGRKLEGVKEGWRWRVGAYRILGQIKDDLLIIKLFRVGHRRDVYRKL
jgi:mRNA interferase RelE/StbE